MHATLDPQPAQRDLLWERCRNSLGIARLLAHEGRPEPLVATACHSAVEAALRAALAPLVAGATVEEIAPTLEDVFLAATRRSWDVRADQIRNA